MASSLNLSLTDELRGFINSRTGDAGVYSTPSEYLRDLIRRDMESQGIVTHVLGGLDDIKHSRFSECSILDIADEQYRYCQYHHKSTILAATAAWHYFDKLAMSQSFSGSTVTAGLSREPKPKAKPLKPCCENPYPL